MTVHCLLQQILCLGGLFLRLAALGTDIVLCPEELLDGFPQGQCIFLILQQGEEKPVLCHDQQVVSGNVCRRLRQAGLLQWPPY